MNIIIETKRLVIAKIDNNDTDRLFQLTGDKRVMKYFPKVLNYPETIAMIEKILQQYQKYGYCFWKVMGKEKNSFIGIAGLLHQIIDGREEMEISYRIKPEYWNCGYATEATRACMLFAQNELNQSRLISIIHPENTASKCVAKKVGAKKSKVATFMGQTCDIYVYGDSPDLSSLQMKKESSKTMNIKVIPFDNAKHREPVISLWNEVFGYEADHNLPNLVIDKKREVDDGLFFVAQADEEVVGTVMAGYDGHRGWIYSMAVSPKYRKRRLGSQLLSFAEAKLSEKGCIKVNLQIMDGNEPVQQFYQANGYQTEKRISMGKRLP